MAYKLAVDDQGAAKVQEDGRVIYIDDTDNREVSVDVNQMFTKISNLNSESANRRRRVNELEQKYSALDGIENVDEYLTKAKDALEKIEELEAGGSGQNNEELEAAKQRLKDSYEAKLSSVNQVHDTRVQQLESSLAEKDAGIHRLMVSTEFTKSEFFAGEKPQTFLTPEMAEKIWGGHFKVEEQNGMYRTVGYDSRGNQLLSRENPGEPAGFQEAIGMIIDSDPNKARYMKAGKSGTGAQGNTDSTDTNDVGVLKVQYKKAQEEGRVDVCLAIKRQLNAIGHPNAVL